MTTNPGNERRDYYRIKDSVGLQYSVCNSDADIPTEDEFIGEVPEEFHLISHLSKIDMDNSTLLHNLSDISPDVSRYLKVINSKIEAIARHVVSIGLTDEIKPRKVTLSAGGLSFLSVDNIALGKTVRSQMILYPSCSGILTYGEVVRCHPISVDGEQQFDIAIEYTLINETDRDALVRHVLQLQSNQLRQKK